MNNALLEQARLRLEQTDRVLIVSHTRPDGDAIGSLLGLGLALQEAGKKVQMVSADGVPAALKFMPGSAQIANQAQGTFDLVIVVDSGNLERVGHALDDHPVVDINIDHHPDNEQFGVINLVDPQAVSTTEILTKVIPQLGLKISSIVASNLLTGLITDTIGFKTENMRPEVLRVAADLYEMGANLPELYHQALVEKTYEAAKYIGSGLLQLTQIDGLVWTSLTLENRKIANYPGRDDADLVNILSAIKNANVAIIFVEQNEDCVKVSWRTRSPEVDVSKVAHRFGGGGHRAAAGALISGSLQEVQAQVIAATQELLTDR